MSTQACTRRRHRHKLCALQHPQDTAERLGRHLGPPSTMMKGSMRQLFRESPLDRLNRRHLHMAPCQHTPCDRASAACGPPD